MMLKITRVISIFLVIIIVIIIMILVTNVSTELDMGRVGSGPVDWVRLCQNSI